jgi:N-acetylglutamate synthase-like GNAT family acetyltransferase
VSAPDTPAVEILPFAPADAAGVQSLILSIQRQEFGVAITLDDQPDLQAIPAFYQCASGQFWVARTGGKVVGTIGLKDIGAGDGALRKMFVDAAWRGGEHRVAARLLETLLAWCASRRMRAVYLGTTEKFLAAHRFYEKHGFRQVDERNLPAAFPRMAVDTRFYVREIGRG